VARKIGAERMQEWLKKLNYAPLIEIDNSNIDEFWLRGDFKITPFEQVSFLRRFCNDGLEISPETKKKMLHIMRVEGDSTLYAKTGWTQSTGIDQGWYVGFKDTPEGRLIFALFIEQVSAPNFMEVRKSIVKECLNLLSEPASQTE
jgi:beta-lactamase class D